MRKFLLLNYPCFSISKQIKKASTALPKKKNNSIT